MFLTEGVRSAFANAFALDSGVDFTDEERALVDRLARLVVQRRLTAPAVMALESARPLSFIGSQILVFFGPLLNVAFSKSDTDRLVHLLERRHSLDLVIDTIHRQEEERL
ncbi:MAG TPA: hypothetical protein DIC52_12655 [Candidatus Latescibacteria bacterium]|nr:hypothetical protein [Candidatus Latescibacterota bacterium]